jgi:hypothetical protein
MILPDPETEWEQVHDLATGLIGALLRLKLHSLSGPQIGSGLPLLVTSVPGDWLRIFFAPVIKPYGDEVEFNHDHIKKGKEHVRLSSLSYTGELMRFDSKRVWYGPYLDISAELQYQKGVIESGLGPVKCYTCGAQSRTGHHDP